ncbi:hypothetical protein D3C73_930490 [compost metagenome]
MAERSSAAARVSSAERLCKVFRLFTYDQPNRLHSSTATSAAAPIQVALRRRSRWLVVYSATRCWSGMMTLRNRLLMNSGRGCALPLANSRSPSSEKRSVTCRACPPDSGWSASRALVK